MSSPNIHDFDLSWVSELAREAGQIALSYFRHTDQEFKADRTMVTAADRAVERFLLTEIRQRYPEDGLLGEEGSLANDSASRRWIIDPIDGTAVYAYGMPIWGVCIGLTIAGLPAAGVVYVPTVDDCFAAGLDGPALRNGEPIRVQALQPYHDDSTIYCSADAHRLWNIDFPGKVRAFGTCAVHICYVAQGSAVGGINTHTALWDITAALAILERAGGHCTLLDGSDLPYAAIQDGSKLAQPIIYAPRHYHADIRSRLRFRPLDGETS